MEKFSPMNFIFTEKYRPSKVSELVGDFKEKIQNYLKDPQSIPSFLLYSKVPGTGKCLGEDTPVLMFDGSIKKVQDIVNTDIVMGPDSKPRIVSGVHQGFGKLFKVEQNYGDDYIVNHKHILSLKSTHKKNIVNIDVKTLLEQSQGFRQEYKGYKVPISFSEKRIELDPYYLGIWLGDGCFDSQRICKPDKEIYNFLYNYGKELGLKIKNHCNNKKKCPMWTLVNKKNEKNVLLEMLRNNNLINNKHIPFNYLCNTREIRLTVLAGLLDTDGSISSGTYEISTKYERLANDIVFLARSLGYKTTIRKKISTIKTIDFVGEYYRIFISGSLWEIPIKIHRKKIIKHKRQKDCLIAGIKISYIGKGRYYGFELSGDGLFLLGDLTVTHNTSLAKAVINELGCDYTIINSSDDRTLDVVREKVKEFALTRSSKEGLKRCVVLDEIDGMLKASQEALRNTMETYSNNVFFILTCNNVNKVIDPIKSRCVLIPFAHPRKEDIIVYVEKVCVAENMKYTADGLKTLVDKNYPSIRNMVVVLQDLHTMSKDVIPENIITVNAAFEDLWVALKKKDWKAIKEKVMATEIDTRELNTFFWQKCLEDATLDVKLLQLLCRNEKDFSQGCDQKVVFITSILELCK